MGEYEEAEAYLANAFRLPLTEEQHASRALRFVGKLESTQPVNLAALSEAVEQRAAVFTQEEGPALEALPFLQVRMPRAPSFPNQHCGQLLMRYVIMLYAHSQCQCRPCGFLS